MYMRFSCVSGDERARDNISLFFVSQTFQRVRHAASLFYTLGLHVAVGRRGLGGAQERHLLQKQWHQREKQWRLALERVDGGRGEEVVAGAETGPRKERAPEVQALLSEVSEGCLFFYIRGTLFQQ